MARPERKRTVGNRPDGEARRGEILDATLGLIAERGVDAVTHRRVAAAAGVPLGSTTYYFESREDLLREAFRRYLAAISADVELHARAAKAHPSVRSVIDFMVQFTERAFARQTVILVEFELILFAARDGSLAEELNAWQDSMVADLAGTFRTLGARSPVEVSRAVIELVRGYEQEQLTRGRPRSADLRRRLQVLIDGYVSAS